MPVTVPIRINTNDNTDLAQQIFFEYFGPERLYALAFLGAGNAGPSVMKSTDGGATWTAQDDANSPGYNTGAWSVIQSGTDLIVCGAHAAGGFFYKTITFDTSTDTWGAESAAGPAYFNSPPAGARQIIAVEVASGDIWAFVDITSGSNGRDSIGYAVFSGGVWSGVTDFVVDNATPTFNFLEQVIVDSANLIHVIYKKNTFGDMSASLYHKTVTVGGVQGAEQAIDLPFSPYSTGRGVAWTNPVSAIESIVVPYYDSTSNLAGVWMGSPAAAPVWTFTLVDTLGWPAGYTDYGVTQAGRGSAYAFVNGTDLYLAWASHDPTYAVVNAIYTAKNDGTGWGTPALYYDEVANPPSWSGDFDEDPEMFADSLIFLGDGSLAGISNVNSVGAAFLPPTSSTCVITFTPNSLPDAVQGMAYSQTITAQEVAPGETFIYQIVSGALPAGLLMNGTAAGPVTSSTGVTISGIPTVSGPVNFTLQATLV